MIYRIQESIFFRNDDGRVWTDDDTSINLTATTGRLLAYLLQHKGNVVSKDELLENVWDAYGLSSSSNSLYKYISDLRAVFKNLGCTEEIIVTVPKLGFMISKTLHVELLEDGERANVTVIEPVIERNKDSIHAEDKPAESRLFENKSPENKQLADISIENRPVADELVKARTWPTAGKIALLSIMLIALVAGIVAFYQRGDSGRQQEITYSLGNIDNCPVRSFTPHESEKSLAVLQNVIATKGMLCSGNSVFFIRVSDPVLTDKRGRIFISRCNYIDDQRKKFSSCENYYRADYEITR